MRHLLYDIHEKIECSIEVSLSLSHTQSAAFFPCTNLITEHYMPVFRCLFLLLFSSLLHFILSFDISIQCQFQWWQWLWVCSDFFDEKHIRHDFYNNVWNSVFRFLKNFADNKRNGKCWVEFATRLNFDE